MPCARAQGLLIAAPGERGRGGPAREGLGSRSDFAVELPGTGRQRRPGNRDPALYAQHRRPLSTRMRWTDTCEIAAALLDAHGEIDPLRIDLAMRIEQRSEEH